MVLPRMGDRSGPRLSATELRAKEPWEYWGSISKPWHVREMHFSRFCSLQGCVGTVHVMVVPCERVWPRQMHSRSALRIFIVLGIAVAIPQAHSCSWATGYFYQVSWLRSKVVGVDDGDWRHPFRWMRQRVERGNTR